MRLFHNILPYVDRVLLIGKEKTLALVIKSGIEPLYFSEIACFTIIRLMRLDFSYFSKSFFCLEDFHPKLERVETNLIARSKSQITRTIKRFSFYDLKLVPFRTGIEFRLAVIVCGICNFI
jgi:hypothetical protein